MRSKKITIVDIAEDDETVINNDVESIKEPQTTEIVWVSTDTVSYTHLTLPTICSV